MAQLCHGAVMQMAAMSFPLCPGSLLRHRIAGIQSIGMALHLGQKSLMVATVLGVMLRPGHKFSGGSLAALQHIAPKSISHGCFLLNPSSVCSNRYCFSRCDTKLSTLTAQGVGELE
jgi:hypothetical protein